MGYTQEKRVRLSVPSSGRADHSHSWTPQNYGDFNLRTGCLAILSCLARETNLLQVTPPEGHIRGCLPV